MINFRYHVVSLTAVFLALAIGLVVGTAALNGQWVDSLYDNVRSLSADNQRLRDQVSHLRDDVNSKEQFAGDAAPLILADKLTAQRVVLVTMSSADNYSEGVRQMLTTAGAKVTGEVQVTDKFTDPANNETLLDIARTAELPGVSLPTNSKGVETSTALLAAVLAPPPQATTASTAGAAKTVLTAYSQGGFITPDSQVTAPANVIVMIAAAPYTDRESSRRNEAVITMIEQLDRAAPLVVASDSTAGQGNAVAALRGDPTLAKTISTVDNVATVQGQVATALVCAEQVAGKTGHYGLGDGAASLIPKKEAQ